MIKNTHTSISVLIALALRLLYFLLSTLGLAIALPSYVEPLYTNSTTLFASRSEIPTERVQYIMEVEPSTPKSNHK